MVDRKKWKGYVWHAEMESHSKKLWSLDMGAVKVLEFVLVEIGGST